MKNLIYEVIGDKDEREELWYSFLDLEKAPGYIKEARDVGYKNVKLVKVSREVIDCFGRVFKKAPKV